MPNALARRKVAPIVEEVRRNEFNVRQIDHVLRVYGSMTLLRLYDAIAETRQIACRCLHERDLSVAPGDCPHRRRGNARCNHQTEWESSDRFAAGAHLAGAYVLQGLGHEPIDVQSISGPASSLWSLDTPIRSAYLRLLPDSDVAELFKSVLAPTGPFAKAATIEELERLIENVRKPHADELDAVRDILTFRFRSMLELRDDDPPRSPHELPMAV